uniref:F-box domain-containing protein n=1 Tax=Globisporangium ultimum (strain ATCC 200006 / CBS 805.95 / DAOM BR144) TaxID=431595 RepID=K3X1Z4_GLOUD
MEPSEDAEQKPLLPPNEQEPPAAPVLTSALTMSQPLPRPLSLRERKLKNQHKRVKLHSKRLRAHWAAIAAFLDLPSTVAFALTCRRLQQVLRDDQVWQRSYSSVRSQRLSQLLVDRAAPEDEAPASAKQSLQRLVHARRVLDPTNSLQRRLREAELDVCRLAAWQRRVRELCVVNMGFMLVLCALSVWSFCVDNEANPEAAGTHHGRHKFHKNRGSAFQTFLVAQDVLSLITLLILSCGSDSTAPNGLATVAVLAVLQCASMVYALVAWMFFKQVLHAGIVLFLVIGNIFLIKQKRLEYERDLAAFIPKY